MTDAIDHFYSIRSSFAYLGAARLNALGCQFGVEVVHRPMDLAALVEQLEDVKGAGPAERAHAGARVFESDPVRERYTRLEYRRWSRHLGIPINVDPVHHYGPRELPSGVVIAAQQRGLDAGRLSHALLEALWKDDRDVSDTAVVAAVIDHLALGVRGDDLCAEATRPEIMDILKANTRLAAERGVFGSPTYFYRGEQFFGQDRIDFLRRALEGSPPP